MFARFFIDRPIFAWKWCPIVIPSGRRGGLFLPSHRAVPEHHAPHRPGDGGLPAANAVVVANTVAAPIEQLVNGVERMLYMSSQSTNDGNYALTVTFAIGPDVNIAQVLVQNRVTLALPQLPAQVQLEGR